MTRHIILFIIISVALIISVFQAVDWRMHIYRTKKYNLYYGYGNFEKFKYQFENRKMHRDLMFGGWECGPYPHEAEITNTGEIQFEHKGMLLPFIDYLQVKWYLYSLKEQHETVKW